MEYIIQNKVLGENAYPVTLAKAVQLGDKTLSEILAEGISKGYDYRLPQVKISSTNLKVNGDDIIGLTIQKNSVKAEVVYISQNMQLSEECEISYQIGRAHV